MLKKANNQLVCTQNFPKGYHAAGMLAKILPGK